MKINGSDLQAAHNVYKTAQAQAVPKSATSSSARTNSGGAAQQDQLALSAQGRAVADAQRMVQSIPDVRESLVSEIRIDFAQGSYMVDHQKAAEGILREAMVNQAAMYA